ncbi:MAG: flagellar filament capping protein FliD [Spirochaetia bacterium]|jgi:flagellar hook-associated protein 2
MSDLSIPGVTDKYNTKKIIDALMAAKTEPLTRMQKERTDEQQKKAVWQDITRKVSGLRDTARLLYGFQNPFNERVASSSDDRTLVGTATRQAVEESKKILVKKVATADRFLSRSLPRDFAVEPGQYTFKVGDKQVSLSWKGGSLRAFADALNARGGDLLSASVVNDTKTTQVLLVEGKLTGSTNRLSFLDKASDMAVATGMLQRTQTGTRQLTFDQKALAQWTKPLSPDGYQVQGGILTVNPGAELKIPVSPAITLNKNMVLELSVKVEKLPEASGVAATPPPGPSVPSTGGIDFKGVHVESAPSETPLPEWQPPKLPENITDLQSLFMEGDGKVIPLTPVPDSAEYQKIQVPVGEMASTLDALDLRNRNTYRRLDVKDISIFDKTQRGDYVPTNALSESGDAVIEMDGIEVKRGTNNIDDLIPGVTLTLKAPSDAPVELAVKHDVEGIKKQVMGLVGSYNQIITDLDVLTRKDESIIENATYLTDDERKKARDNLGLLFGDLSLQQLKSSMQNIMMNPYPTSLGRDLSLLAQIGISTDTRAPGAGGIDKTRLRGYLEIDEQKFTAEVEKHAEAVHQLFGNDTTGDLVVDSGAAFKLDTLLTPYVTIGGIMLQRATTLDQQIAASDRDIANYKRKLDDYQAELKRKYGEMGGALDNLQKSSQSMQNFNKQNGQ